MKQVIVIVIVIAVASVLATSLAFAGRQIDQSVIVVLDTSGNCTFLQVSNMSYRKPKN